MRGDFFIMSEKLSRRDWLKTSAVAGSVLAFSSFDLSSEAFAGSGADKLVRLTSNENLYGFSPKAKQAILDSISLGNQYADSEKVAELEKMIAGREGLKPKNVVLGSGSGEVLCMTGAAFGWEKGEIVTPELTFPMLFRYAENFDAKIEKVPLNEKHEHDLEGLEKRVSAKTSLCYVCNPNNPTGTYLPPKIVKDFCEEISKRTTVFVDEAYLEYTDEFPANSMAELVRQEKNVIVSRTFSKIYGMAGMRIGYGLAKAEIAEKLKRFRMTWFNSLGVNAAIAAYKDTDFISQSREKNKTVREFLSREFTSLKMPFAESHGNFIWVYTGEKNRNLAAKMRPAGLLVRPAPPPYEDWMRLTIGTMEQMRTFVKVLQSA